MRIVFITSRIPFPPHKGDQLRAFQQIKMLSSLHEVHLISIDVSGKNLTKSFGELEKFCTSINVFHKSRFKAWWSIVKALFGSTALQVAYFFSPKLSNQINSTVRQIKPDLLYFQLARTVKYAAGLQEYKLAVDLQDAFSKGLMQRSRQSYFPLSYLFSLECKRLQKFESDIIRQFNHVYIISNQDKEYFNSIPDHKKIEILPNAVDTEKFSSKSVAKDIDICFTGNMDYAPNIATALFLIRDVFPLVQKEMPQTNLYIVGANPHRSITVYRSANIVVTGWVDNIVSYYRRTKVFCAPMNSGIGLQNKLLEAMAVGVPCITSSLCNAAINAISDQHLIVSDSAERTANEIIRLLMDQDRAKQIGDSGREFVHENFSPNKVEAKLLTLFRAIQPKEHK